MNYTLLFTKNVFEVLFRQKYTFPQYVKKTRKKNCELIFRIMGGFAAAVKPLLAF